MTNKTEHFLVPEELGADAVRSAERGVALAIALLFTFIAGSVIISGSLMLRANRAASEVRFRQQDQAAQFAKSGLVEAMSWFRRQTAQPVTDFNPLRDESASPKILDTDDPVIGLVRDFRIAKNIWGRYEVWRKDETDPDPTRLEFRRKFEVEDLSTERGFSGGGNVWLLRSIGYVYEKRNGGGQWNEPPNRILGVSTYETEIQRLSIQPPGQAAVCSRRGDDCTIGSNGRIRGGPTGGGIFYPSGTGSPSIGPLSENRVTGSPATSANSPYDDSVRAVFGVSRNELRSMADLVLTSSANFPDPVPLNSIVFVEGGVDLTFDALRSLNGTAIVYVEGDVTAAAGNNSSFNGLLFVDGDLDLNETCDIYGSVIVTGKLTAKGTGDYATVWFDDTVMNDLRASIGQYRWAGAFRAVIRNE